MNRFIPSQTSRLFGPRANQIPALSSVQPTAQRAIRLQSITPIPTIHTLLTHRHNQLHMQLQRRHFATIPKYPWGSSMRLAVGDTCSMTNTFTKEDVYRFGQSSHDWNPVHYPDLHQQTTEAEIKKWKGNPATTDLPLPKTGIFRFQQPIVHGLLTASLIGTLFATHLPGSIYLSQNLNFRAPVYYNESVTVKIEVINIDRKRVTCKTTVEKVDTKKGGWPVMVIEGEATVLVDGLQMDDSLPPKEWQEKDRFQCLSEATWMQLRQRELRISTNGAIGKEVNKDMLKDTRFIQLASIVSNDKSPAAALLTLSTDPNILLIQLPFTHISTTELFRPLLPEDHALIEKYISRDYANMIQSLRFKNDYSDQKRVEFIDRMVLACKDYQFMVTAPYNVSTLTKEGQRRFDLYKASPDYRAYTLTDLFQVTENAYGADIVDSFEGKTPFLLREVELFHMISNQLSSKLSATNEPAVRDELTDAIQRFRYLAQIRMNEFMLLLPAVMQYMDSLHACTPSVRCKFILFYFQSLFLSCLDRTQLKQLGPVIDHVTTQLTDDYLTDDARTKLASSDSFIRLTKLHGKYYQLVGDHARAIQIYESIPKYHFDWGNLDSSLEDLPSDTLYELSNSSFHLNQLDSIRDYCSRGFGWLEQDRLKFQSYYQEHLATMEIQQACNICYQYKMKQLRSTFHAMCTSNLQLIQKLVEQNDRFEELLKQHPKRITSEQLTRSLENAAIIQKTMGPY